MGEPLRVLIIEDEEDIAEFVSLELEYEGYTTQCVTNGRQGLETALKGGWDLILLDIMLPEISGMEICRRIRSVDDVPIIMLTARQSVPDRVAGLDGGADDYIPKPFAIEELLARIRVALRKRVDSVDDTVLMAHNIVLDLSKHEVRQDDEPIALTAREFSLLEIFIRNKNHVLTRNQILEKVWGYDFAGETNVVDVYVRYLRNKIGSQFIQTVRGVGYMLKV